MVTIAERMGLTKNERRRLWKWECGWCGQVLAQESCGSIYEVARCTEKQRHERRQRALGKVVQK